VVLLNTDPVEPFTIHRGDRIAQLVVAPVARARFLDVGELPTTPRGDGGFGSTGR
jgi:dUTP diphosphatase